MYRVDLGESFQMSTCKIGVDTAENEPSNASSSIPTQTSLSFIPTYPTRACRRGAGLRGPRRGARGEGRLRGAADLRDASALSKLNRWRLLKLIKIK